MFTTMNDNDYLEFLADLYEQEDLFWKEYFEDIEADYWIWYMEKIILNNFKK